MRQNTLKQRLNIIQGQINALAGSIEEDKDCRQVTGQLYAINAGLKKVIQLYFQQNLETCLKPGKKADKKKLNFLLKEVIKNK